jgi:hypothetical protein
MHIVKKTKVSRPKTFTNTPRIEANFILIFENNKKRKLLYNAILQKNTKLFNNLTLIF